MLGNPALVGDREIHTLSLRAIAQSRVVDFDSLSHKTFPSHKGEWRCTKSRSNYHGLSNSFAQFSLIHMGFSQVNWAM